MQAQKVLHKLIQNTCPDMHKTRRDSLEANVMAALSGQRLTVTDLGRSIQSQTSHKHNIKRADRLLSNIHLQKIQKIMQKIMGSGLVSCLLIGELRF